MTGTLAPRRTPVATELVSVDPQLLTVRHAVTPTPALESVARKHAVTPAQVALAWLLQRSAALLPIPGTSSLAHLEQNVAAAALALDDEDVVALA